VVTELPDVGADWLRVSVDVPGVEPGALWRAWTDPGELERWWPQTAELDVRVGGAYHLAWPQKGWHLRGSYTEVDAPSRLAFTWQWDHEPETPVRTVTIDLQPLPDGAGTRLIVTHGPYGDDPAEAADREGHLEGWTGFLERLVALQTGAA
jgi:uncharacterized protein YndB with AHSA1/START domain